MSAFREAGRVSAFLPVSREDMEARGWDWYDFLIINGDAYVDHPSFGGVVIARVLEAEGYRVAYLAQPDWHSAEPFQAMGRPRLGVMISAWKFGLHGGPLHGGEKAAEAGCLLPRKPIGTAAGPGHHRLCQPGAGGFAPSR